MKTTERSREVVAKLRDHNAVTKDKLTRSEIKKVPASIVFGTLTVLKKPEPIRRQRKAKSRRS